MPSSARQKFGDLIARADLLSVSAGAIRKKTGASTKKVLLHAALATQVAAWDVYIKAVAEEYFGVISNPSDIRFSAMHELLLEEMNKALRKLNTPNSQNCRDFLLRYSGFDPWPCWVAVKFEGVVRTSSLQNRELMDEILRLRHSFAHGLALPAYPWNRDSSGAAILNCKIINDTRQFFVQICDKTDSGLSGYISSRHGISAPW